ncbi:hypothetical protein P9273_14310 [Mesorhizobium sp. WSM4935]|uniref:hypothetical protein n=1 Tax=Mesorhizobium sp. WSM4935 TaxID=3038547 RepID=UPI002415046C|nr:hypothetical protein [Mesorhizobium sp. WSM4935]MDG4876272.1 hypothetical protein [Mesorhizobium sp. WSM4935]
MLALILEDEYLIANDLAGDLKEAGFEVNCAASDTAAAGAQHAKRCHSRYQAVGWAGRKGCCSPKGTGRSFHRSFWLRSGFSGPIFQGVPYLPKPAPVRHLVSLAARLAQGSDSTNTGISL